MPYDNFCTNCPYVKQSHLVGNKHFSNRPLPPIELENNQSKVLLVFQAPGINEWSIGHAIHRPQNSNRTAGARIAASWNRKNRQRTDFDIVNAVRCFPGRGATAKRDKAPRVGAINLCAKKLNRDLNSRNYAEIITFGSIANSVVGNIIPTLNYNPAHTSCRHPSRGCSNQALDSLW